MLISALAALVLNQTKVSRKDIVLADFEGNDYGGWTATGTAFGTGPARGTLPNQMAVSGYKGHGLANSYHGGDDSTGTLTSPAFTIKRTYIDFLIGGGKIEGKTCLNLLIDGKVVRTETGPNDRPGGSEALAWKGWDVSEYEGKVATIEIVDLAKGGWGHICVDQITESDRKREAIQVQRSISVDKNYLLFPVKNGAPKARVKCEIDGKWLTEFTIELAADKPDFWVFLDTKNLRGKSLTISTQSDGDINSLSSLKASNEIAQAGALYKEALRPQFHFSSRVGWLNDPNGLVYHDGEYHLFYQHNPYGWSWDNMHWGHAVSRDLMHWKELPIAIYPHQWDDWVFSGSAVIDQHNTSGFKSGSKDVMVAAYTSTGRGECIAYSQDGGRTFTDYAENPVVKHSGRDPKMFWYEPGHHWVMALYDELDGKQWIEYLSSPDLKHWTSESRIEGFFECPELFELPVEGHPDQKVWATYAANGEYRLGDFDGKTFTPVTEKLPIQHGNIFYASQTYNDAPGGRRIQVGWGRSESPGMPFNQCMLCPSELTLRETPSGKRIFVNPAREIETLYQKEHFWQGVDLHGEQQTFEVGKTGLLDLQLDLSLSSGSKVELSICGSALLYDSEKGEIEFRGCHGPLTLISGKLRLRILVDRTTVEIYGNDGEMYMPVGGLNVSEHTVSISAKGGKARIDSLKVHELKPSMTLQNQQ